MNRTFLILLLAIITIGMAGCAAHHNKLMAGATVDMPDEKPMSPVSSNPSSPPPALNFPQAPGPKDTVIQIGDILEVIVTEDHSYNGYYEVRRGGYIILPSVGRVEAAGLRLKEIEAKVSKALVDTQLPQATVRVGKIGETHSGRER